MNDLMQSQINSLPHILLVDDYEGNRWMVTRLLEHHNYRVSTAMNGEEAITAVKQTQFDLVLMDVQMPVMDGLTATQIIRQHEQETGTHVPIIAFTSVANTANAQQYWDAGMDGFMEKAIHPDEFLSTVEAALTLHATRSHNASVPPTFDLADALQSVNNDSVLLQQMVRQFLNLTPNLISALHHAIAIEDSKKLHVSAHRLANIASNLSAYGVAELAKHLELIGSVRKLTQARTALTALEQELMQFKIEFAQAIKNYQE